MRIIGITGKAGSGKDTVADWLVRNQGYIKLSWAEPLKAALAAMGFPEPINRSDKEKQIEGFDFSWRQAAQTLGTEWGRALDPNIWVKIATQRMRRAGDKYVIADVRFENEAAAIRAAGGKMLFLTGRQCELGNAAGHVSEAGVEYYPSLDSMIDNSGEFTWTVDQVRVAMRKPA